jgi:hypothetical protein
MSVVRKQVMAKWFRVTFTAIALLSLSWQTQQQQPKALAQGIPAADLYIKDWREAAILRHVL